MFICSCKKSEDSKVLKIDPRFFPESEMLLSDIANDVKYIPIENKFPIGHIYSYKFACGYIYMAIKDVGIVRYTIDGKLDKKYGKIGRGPGEYVYFLKFALEDTNGSVYVLDQKMNDIEVYKSDGKHIRNIKLQDDDYGFGFSDIEFNNSLLFLAQYINMGHGEYNWLITDTLGEIKKIKKNPYPLFEGRWGGNGGIFKYKNSIGYWDSQKDTIFKISPDLSHHMIALFSQGEHRFPKNSEAYDPIETYKKNRANYCMSYVLIETDNFFVYKYFLDGLHLALIDKEDIIAQSITINNNKKGITNNIDGGIDFNPENYFECKNEEYLISILQPFVIRYHIASRIFKNSTPKYPEKKDALSTLADNLNENDNPVLMLVRLKE